ncbi:TPA: endonuclease III domain-containing protein [Candidatus Poribacteria bacterium]|nr:endonuclease III domain-containing protein [Candidatus Poribacteria bacterium]
MQNWWPGESQFEIIVGAILTQNTSWNNVSKAIDNLKRHDLMDLESFANADPDLIKKLITPAGFYNIKQKRLTAFINYLINHKDNFNRFYQLPIADIRKELLSINGIGKETADSILLYGFERPIFVIDAYTKRLFSRLGFSWMKKATYDEIQQFFMDNLPLDSKLFNEYHALIVVHCKALCKKKPLCSECHITCPSQSNK